MVFDTTGNAVFGSLSIFPSTERLAIAMFCTAVFIADNACVTAAFLVAKLIELNASATATKREASVSIDAVLIVAESDLI